MERDGRGSVVPAEVQEVLDLFEDDLAEVRFPDVDIEVLTSHVAIVEEHLKEAEITRAAFEQARIRLEEAQSELRSKAKRALAYAKIFADGDEALAERLGAMTLGGEPPQKKKPKRKSKIKTASKASIEKKASDEIASRMEELPFVEPPSPPFVEAPGAN